MPYRSQAQMRWAFATGQRFAQQWADKTKHPDRLPLHVRQDQARRSKNLAALSKHRRS